MVHFGKGFILGCDRGEEVGQKQQYFSLQDMAIYVTYNRTRFFFYSPHKEEIINMKPHKFPCEAAAQVPFATTEKRAPPGTMDCCWYEYQRA